MDTDVLLAIPISELEHHGVKGMKWGQTKAGKLATRAKVRAKEEIGSKKREYAVRKTYANRRNYSDVKLKNVSERAATEQRIKKNLRVQFKNQLKTGRIIIDKPLMKDRKTYRNRGKLSNKLLKQFDARVQLDTQLSRVLSKTIDQDLKDARTVINTYRKVSTGALLG